MKWLQAELQGKIQTGEDELRNPIYETKRICTFLGRFTLWNITEITALGNTYTLCRRKLLTRSYVIDEIPQDYELCTIIIDGNLYTIEGIKKLNNKFTVLTIKAVKL